MQKMNHFLMATLIMAIFCHITNGLNLGLSVGLSTPDLTTWSYTDCLINVGSADCIRSCGIGDGSNGQTTCTTQVIGSLISRKVCNCRSVQLKTLPSNCQLLDVTMGIDAVTCLQTCNFINTVGFGASCQDPLFPNKKYCSCIPPVLTAPVLTNDDPTWPFASCTLDKPGSAACNSACGVSNGANGPTTCASQLTAGGAISRHICNCRSGQADPLNMPPNCQIIDATMGAGAVTCTETCNLISTGDIGAACSDGVNTYCACIPLKTT